LELIMHHCSVELQERELVEDNLLGDQTAEERKIWL
jgi:hypothetical protein